LIYEKKLERTNLLYQELSNCFAQLEERELQIALREKQIGARNTYKKTVQKLRKQHFDKINRRNRFHIPTSEIAQTNLNLSPASPIKKSIYVELDGSHSIVSSESSSKYNSKKRGHKRSGSSGSSKKTIEVLKVFETIELK
jgi:hypothetical protein